MILFLLVCVTAIGIVVGAWLRWCLWHIINRDDEWGSR